MQLKKLMLSDIKGSVYQPRSQDDLELQGLVESILRNGLICPIIVRQYRNSYKIVCGNRRYEALRTVETNRHPLSLPDGAASIDKDGMVSTLCLVLPSGGKVEDACINALVDNIERLDLTPLERARCYKHMTKELKISVRKLAERLDMTHAYIAKLMRILDLPREIQQALDSRLISYNHVMVIMRLKGRQRQMELFKKIMEERLSPLDAEFWCARLLGDEEIPIAHRQFDKFEEKLISNDTIESWVTNKKLRMVKSRKGERIIFNVESVDEFLDIVDVIRSTGFKIWR